MKRKEREGKDEKGEWQGDREREVRGCGREIKQFRSGKEGKKFVHKLHFNFDS